MIEGQHGLLSGAFKAGDVLIAPLAGRKGSVECIIQKIVHDEDQVVAYCDDAAFIAIEGLDGVKAMVQEDSMIAEAITNPEPLYEGEGESRKMNVTPFQAACIACTFYEIATDVHGMLAGASKAAVKKKGEWHASNMSKGKGIAKKVARHALKGLSVIGCIRCLAGAANDAVNAIKDALDLDA